MDAGNVVGMHPTDSPGPGERVFRLLHHSTQKELQPRCPLSADAYLEQMVVILLSMFFEVGAEIKKGCREHVLSTEVENHEEPAEAPVSVYIGMDSLELIVGEGALNQRRHLQVCVHKDFP